MQIKEEFIIEGFQNFEECIKINPVSVRIIDPVFRINYYFIQRNINIDLLLTVYYLVFQLKKTQRLFLLQRMV